MSDVTVEERTAIPVHHTDTSEAAWDGPAAVAAMPNDPATLRYCHAWVDSAGADDAKSSYKLPHHETDGGPAILPGVRNGLARLQQTKNIPKADLPGVMAHLEAHLTDGQDQQANDADLELIEEARAWIERELAGANEEAPTPADVLDTDRSSTSSGTGRSATFSTIVSPARAARADKTGREERRGSLELRAAGDGSVDVFGYASKFNEPYTVTDMFGDFTEVVDPGAFTRTITEQDVRMYVNHEGMALARSSVNLELREDATGLAYDARLDPSVSIVSDLAKLMRAGIMRESSFAFQPIRQSWNADYTERHLEEVKLFDVSVVSLPANPAASAGIRSAELVRWLGEMEPVALAGELRSAGIGEASVWDAIASLAGAASEVREGKVLSSANAKLVRDAVDALQALLNAAEPAAPRDAGSMMVESAIVEVARRKR